MSAARLMCEVETRLAITAASTAISSSKNMAAITETPRCQSQAEHNQPAALQDGGGVVERTVLHVTNQHRRGGAGKSRRLGAGIGVAGIAQHVAASNVALVGHRPADNLEAVLR